MEALKKHTGIAAPLDRSNVDTDQIIPKQFLKKIERTGFGVHLFHDWRYLDDAETRENPDFVLNQEPYQKATVLLSRENFGCGSSREHAPWALADFGFRVIIAPSYADIFYNNSFKNGILPIKLSPADVDRLFTEIQNSPGAEIEADLENCVVKAPSGKEFSFEVDPFRRESLLNGWDDIGLTMRDANDIDQFERQYFERRPFLVPGAR